MEWEKYLHARVGCVLDIVRPAANTRIILTLSVTEQMRRRTNSYSVGTVGAIALVSGDDKGAKVKVDTDYHSYYWHSEGAERNQVPSAFGYWQTYIANNREDHPSLNTVLRRLSWVRLFAIPRHLYVLIPRTNGVPSFY